MAKQLTQEEKETIQKFVKEHIKLIEKLTTCETFESVSKQFNIIGDSLDDDNASKEINELFTKIYNYESQI